ncbi:MAG: hypothetical protein LBS32_00625 [Clostridiales Family XIII bacterium]|jgi:hypothetical protein|nr:hypothetical protein [Clostridiales Family XIII bacterium]
MKRIKDLLYDINDIIVVLAIIAVAALLIWSRIDAIMAYPSTGGQTAPVSGGDGLILGSGEDGGAEAQAGEEDAGGGENPAGGPSEGDAGTPPPEDPGGVPADAGGEQPDGSGAAAGPDAQDGAQAEQIQITEYSLYIAYGETAAQIAQKLIDAGIIGDSNDFYDALIEADAATRLQAGTFIIPAVATPAEIVRILTGG